MKLINRNLMDWNFITSESMDFQISKTYLYMKLHS